MNANRLHPELRGAIAKLPKLPFHIRPLIPLTRQLYNLASRSKLDPGVDVTLVKQDRMELRVFKPQSGGSNAGVLWCYGGGHLAGKTEHVNRIANRIVAQTGATVFAPKYRLAPKNPFPADLDDCFGAWEHICRHADTYGVSAERLAIGGHSAGGGLAAALALRIQDCAGPQPKAQILFYPMLDDRLAADTSRDELETFIWDNPTNRVAWNAYLAPYSVGDTEVSPYAAPARRVDLAGLPPTWIGFGDVDLFADEDEEYANRLKDAGVRCEVLKVPGAPHAFEAICPKAAISQQFEQAGILFLKEALME